MINQIENRNNQYVSNIENQYKNSIGSKFSGTLLNVSCDVYISELKGRFDAQISVQNIENSQSDINKIGNSTVGTNNIIIADNILRKISSDDNLRKYYEQKIQDHFDWRENGERQLNLLGHKVISSGVIIYPNGDVSYYCKSEKIDTESHTSEDEPLTDNYVNSSDTLLSLYSPDFDLCFPTSNSIYLPTRTLYANADED